MARRLTALVLLGLALLGAGCGGDDDGGNEYADEFPQLSERIVSIGEEVGQVIQGAAESTDEQLADDFGDFARDLGAVRQDLEELEPPEELAERHDELMTAMSDVRASLEDISTAAEEHDADAARDATVGLIEESEDLRDARRDLARAVREQE